MEDLALIYFSDLIFLFKNQRFNKVIFTQSDNATEEYSYFFREIRKNPILYKESPICNIFNTFVHKNIKSIYFQILNFKEAIDLNYTIEDLAYIAENNSEKKYILISYKTCDLSD